MKRKNVCAKLLLLFLCFTLAFAGLVGCKTDELEEKMNAMQNELNGVKEDKAEAEALAELKALVEEVKATADAAATVAKFEEAIAKLESADAANSDALNTAKEELKALIDANANTADAATKAALKEALDKITALEAAAATKEALKTEVDALVAAIDKKADKTALEAAIADLQGKIDANGTADAKTKAELQAAINELKTASEKGDKDLGTLVTNLQALVNQNAADAAADLKTAADKAAQDLEDAKAILEAEDTKNRNELQQHIDKVVADLEANGAADADVVADLAALKDLVDTKADATDINGKLVEITNAINANKLACETALGEQVEALTKLINANGDADADVVADLAALEELVATKADAATVKAQLDALQNKIDAIDYSDDIANAIAGVNAEVSKKASTDFVLTEVNALNDKILANAKAIATLQADVDAAELALAAAEDAIEALEADVEALETATAALDKAVKANAEAITAANEAIEALEARVKALEDDTTAADALKAAVEELKQADADADKAIADLDAAYKAADADLEAKIDEAKTALEGKIDEAKTTLEGKIAEVDAKLAALATKAEFTTLQGIVDTLKADVEALKNTNHLDIYEEATKVLVGSKDDTGLVVIVTRDENKKIVSVETVALGTEGAKEYSLDAFAALKATVKQNEYIPAEYAAFIAECENIEFFLGRAVSPIAIVEYFDKLEAYIAKMPSLIQTFEDLLKPFVEHEKYLTTDPLCLGAYDENATEDETKTFGIKGTYGLILKQNEGKFPAEYSDLEETYQALVVAHDNLVAAEAASKAVEDVIEKIGYVVYTADCSAAIEAGWQALYAFEETYLANPEYTKYYEVEKDTLVANYQALSDAHERYAVLGFAAADKVAIEEIALDYNNSRPLWKELKALTDNFAEVVAWATEYGIDLAIAEDAPYVIGETKDADTLETIYADELDLLQAAIAYATAMNDIYTTKEFAGLGEEKLVGVDALNAATAVLANIAVADVKWTDMAQFQAYSDAYGDLLAAIMLVSDYPASDIDKDDNYKEMMASVADGIKAVTARLTKLNEANNALDTLYDNNAALLGNVTFKDFDTIDALKKAIDDVYVVAEVAVDDDNYKAFAAEKDVNKLYVDLLAEYMDLTAKVREIYDTVTELMAGAPMRLAFGNDLDGFMDEVLRIMDLGVPSNNLTLPGKDGAETANLDTLLANLTTLAAQYEALAEEAEAEAAKVATAIKNIKSATTLNNYSAIKAVYADDLQAWITKYLAGDVAFANGDVVKAIDDVNTVKRYNKSAGEAEFYTFLVIDDYNKGVETMAAADELLKNANAEWATLKVTLETLTAKTWSIHDIQAYIDADAAFLAYVKAYYNTAATADDPLAVITKEGEQNGEKAVYSAFKIVYDKCQNAVNDSAADKKGIEDAIAALPVDITVANYAEVLAQVKVIDQLVADYTEAYCADLCEDCVAADLLLTVRVKDTIAQLIAYGEEQKALVDDATDVKIDGEVSFYKNLIKKVSSANTAKTTLNVAKGAINDIVDEYIATRQ